jgi:hypothetical protein
VASQAVDPHLADSEKVMVAVDKFDFEALTKQFLGDEKPLAESITVKDF